MYNLLKESLYIEYYKDKLLKIHICSCAVLQFCSAVLFDPNVFATLELQGLLKLNTIHLQFTNAAETRTEKIVDINALIF